MKELCSKLGIDQTSLVFLGGGREDSDGTVYTYDNGTKVLKILAIPVDRQDAADKLCTQIEWAGMLGDNDIACGCPIHNHAGHLYETSLDNNHYFTAYTMNFVNGSNPESLELTDSLVHDWGKLTGKTHALTKNFSKALQSNTKGYSDEMEFFTSWCKDPEIKKKWQELKKELDVMNRDSNSYGFIHNDNHQKNILVDKGNITLIDFDCATNQYFMQDIITPAQGIMFDETGGIMSPYTGADRLHRFIDSFLNGYEQSNHIDDACLKDINTFFNYRRLLLYTCMQDWVCSVPELKKGFTDNIMNPPKIM